MLLWAGRDGGNAGQYVCVCAKCVCVCVCVVQEEKVGKDMDLAQPDSRRKRWSRSGSPESCHTKARDQGLYLPLSKHWLPEASSSPSLIL